MHCLNGDVTSDEQLCLLSVLYVSLLYMNLLVQILYIVHVCYLGPFKYISH